MCEFEKSLVAWIDGELQPDAALTLERHLETCETCSATVVRYREATSAFAAYYTSTPIQKGRPRLLWTAAGAAALAAAAAILLMLRTPAEQLPLPSPKSAEPPAMAFQAQPSLPAKLPAHALPSQPRRAAPAAFQSRRANSPAPATAANQGVIARRNEPQQASWPGLEPFVEISIPADAIFAPGAVPPGVSFAADLSIGGDGSPRVLRVQPGIYLK